MKTRALLLLALLAACDPGTTTGRTPTSTTTKAGEGPVVSEGTVKPPPPLEPPGAGETLYVCWIKDAQDRPVMGVVTMLLTEVPEGAYMREPVRATVISTYKTPDHGRVHHLYPPQGQTSDGKPKYLWIGRNGVEPFVTELGPAVGGKTDERTIRVTLIPTATLVVLDPKGNLVADALVTIKKNASDASVGNTYRTNGAGELQVTMPPGTYILDAADENGRHRYIDRAWQWTGDPAPVRIQLPEKAMQ